MKLKSLTLTNFQGIRSLRLDPNTDSINIYGENASGKTTVFNAITWLLFDKSSTGAKNFSPKTIGTDGKELHNLEHSSEGKFVLNDGKIVTFKKALHEVYRKKRGSAESEFTGNTIEYFVDGVPVKANEYNNAVAVACGLDINKTMMLTMPDYFAETIDWKERRKILLSICGDSTDEDIINSDPKLSELKELLLIEGTTNQYYTVDDFKAIQASKMKTINKSLESIPVRIDEANRAIKNADSFDEAELKATLEETEKKIAEETKLSEGEMPEKEAYYEIQKQMRDAETDFYAKHIEECKPLQTELIEVRKRASELFTKRTEAHQKVEKLSYCYEDVLSRRVAIIEEAEKLMGTEWDSSKEICPTCKRKLDPEDIQRIKANFERGKTDRLKTLKGLLSKYTKESVEELYKNLGLAQAESDKLDKEYEAVLSKNKELDMRLSYTPKFEDSDEYASLNAEKAVRQANYTKALDNEYERKAAKNALLNTLRASRGDILGKLAMIENAKTQEARIAELEAEEKNLAKEYQMAEKAVHLCELFMRDRVDAITENINKHFRNVRFRLFVEQINGGLKEDCEVLIPTEEGRLIPYSFANTAGRMNAGLEIISVLGKAWDKTMPVIVDNAEAISKHNWKTISGTQMIRLFVSEGDTTLRIETEKEN